MLIGSFDRYAQICGSWLTMHGKECKKYGLLIWMTFQEQVFGWITRTCDRIFHCQPTTKRKKSGKATSYKYLQASYKTKKKLKPIDMASIDMLLELGSMVSLLTMDMN